jgi:hypothetical protein
MHANLIKMGDTIINLDTVMMVHLDWRNDEGESFVVLEFVMRGSDEAEDGQNIAQPYMKMFKEGEAEILRGHFGRVLPDLFTMG